LVVIILDLLCERQHRFEGWFASSEAFREQRSRDMVNCPHCDSASVTQLPSAPYVRRRGTEVADEQGLDAQSSTAVAATTAVTSVESAPVLMSPQAELLVKMLTNLARQAENVGDRFAEEARRIHYDEIPARNIRGVTSRDEALELLEEGILVLPVPVPPVGETH